MGDVLFLAHRVPYPPDRGDKIRGYHILKHLAAKRRVHLIAFADDARDMRVRPELAKLTQTRLVAWRGKSRRKAGIEALVQRRPISLTAFDARHVRAAVNDALLKHSIDMIYVFSSQMAQYLPEKTRAKVVMDFVDMDSAKFAAYADAARWPASWVMRREANLLLNFERRIARRVDASLFVSEAEAQLFRDATGAENVRAIENGIDTERYDPAASFKRIDATGTLIVFTGQMDYRPNIEAVTWFAQAILPHIRVAHPDARFAIVGRNPTPEVSGLAGDAVIVTGEVPDVRGWLAAASVVVAPLKLARGIQNKVLEAMAMARPVVASTAAAEGIDHRDTIRVGGDVAQIANAVCALLSDPGAAVALGRSAREQVQLRYGWEATLAPLDGLFKNAKPGRQKHSEKVPA
jgi:sugar transferase (PEP-CTERM/EpsH1 system associated)